MKKLHVIILALCALIASENIMAGSGKSWGIGLGAAAGGYMLGRSHGRKKRERQEPRHTEVVTVQAPASSVTSQLEIEQNRCRQLQGEVDELERKNRRLDKKLEKFEENLEKLKDENKELKEKLRDLQKPQESKGFFN